MGLEWRGVKGGKPADEAMEETYPLFVNLGFKQGCAGHMDMRDREGHETKKRRQT